MTPNNTQEEELEKLPFEELIKTPVTNMFGYRVVDKITFKDGESISIQASRTHYCSPKSNEGPWVSVEMGFPSFIPSKEIMEYIENEEEDPKTSVYPFVPVGLVRKMIEEHGGEQ